MSPKAEKLNSAINDRNALNENPQNIKSLPVLAFIMILLKNVDTSLYQIREKMSIAKIEIRFFDTPRHKIPSYS